MAVRFRSSCSTLITITTRRTVTTTSQQQPLFAVTRLIHSRPNYNNKSNTAAALLQQQNSAVSVSVSARRTMATETTGRKYEWLVVVPDFPGALSKRVEARPLHFAGLQDNLKNGLFQMGGAILDDVPADDQPSSLKMKGSALVMEAESKEEILAKLREDVYAKSGVWDVDNAQMWPFKCAFRFPVKGQ